MKLKKNFTTNEINTVYIIQISENLYSLTQHRGNTYFEFFDLFFTDFNEIQETDLNEINVLFTKSCAADRFKNFFVKEIDTIKPNDRPIETLYLHPFHYIFKKIWDKSIKEPYVSLVRLRNINNCTNYDVVIEKLDCERDIDNIYKYTTLGLCMLDDGIKEKLYNYATTGILWSDIEKSAVFPTISLETIKNYVNKKK